MILVDFNQVMISNVFVNLGNHLNAEINEDMIRHMVLNSLRASRRKFKNKYGELVICCDGKHSWRKNYFPYYKANRKVTREESELDWESLFEKFDIIKNEMRDYFPYKMIQIDSCEADDIIGVIVKEHGKLLNARDAEKILILSTDKDFIQLQKYANVDQYDPINKKWLVNSDPEEYLRTHILKGDRGDGIPNILSPDDSFVTKKRQKPMTAKRLEMYRDLEEMDEETREKWDRNKRLIDLEETPDEERDAILKEWEKEPTQGREKLYKFFFKKKLNNLMEHIGDF